MLYALSFTAFPEAMTLLASSFSLHLLCLPLFFGGFHFGGYLGVLLRGFVSFCRHL